jgi:hypothetical protein
MTRNIVFVFFLLIGSLSAVAQSSDDSAQVIFSKYRPVYNGGKWNMPLASITEILANPEFTSSSGFRVTSFSISIKPARAAYIGPYFVKGPKLTPYIMDVMKKHAGNSGEIYLEDIKAVGTDRKYRAMGSILLKYTN